ncbi:hypothetical protein QVD17_02312 [Tagetes erecta]|uniref:Uncharacterized protein n=1 Tax=Tagetes erecta TaxID=13708 RepID=A0AAD8P922_TARER|nr:hypothetical protein QVD17_02312 [Tagetes erecta]
MCGKPLGDITVSELSCIILLVEAKQQSVYTGCKSANDLMCRVRPLEVHKPVWVWLQKSKHAFGLLGSGLNLVCERV